MNQEKIKEILKPLVKRAKSFQYFNQEQEPINQATAAIMLEWEKEMVEFAEWLDNNGLYIASKYRWQKLGETEFIQYTSHELLKLFRNGK